MPRGLIERIALDANGREKSRMAVASTLSRPGIGCLADLGNDKRATRPPIHGPPIHDRRRRRVSAEHGSNSEKVLCNACYKKAWTKRQKLVSMPLHLCQAGVIANERGRRHIFRRRNRMCRLVARSNKLTITSPDGFQTGMHLVAEGGRETQNMMKTGLRQSVVGSGELCVGTAPAYAGVPLHNDKCQRANIALIDEYPLRRTCTVQLLRAYKFKVVLPFANAAELPSPASIKPRRPSVIIIYSGARSLMETAVQEQLRLSVSYFSSTPVIIMSDIEDCGEIVAAFREGVRGYVPTSLEPRLVIEAIRMVLANVPFVPVEMLLRLRRQSQHGAGQPRLEEPATEEPERWPPRQLAVLRLLVQGRPNKEIARALALEENTIKVHVRLIMRKLGVTNRTQAALSVRQRGTTLGLDGPLASIKAEEGRAAGVLRLA